MEKVKSFFANITSFLAGYGFYGIGLLGWALLGFFFLGGLGNAIAFGFIGAFIGKNMQAIKEAIGKIKL